MYMYAQSHNNIGFIINQGKQNILLLTLKGIYINFLSLFKISINILLLSTLNTKVRKSDSVGVSNP